MRKLLLFISLLLPITTIPITAIAGGTTFPGVVTVAYNGSVYSVLGMFGVSKNPAVTTGWIGVNVTPGGFLFHGADSKTGVGFSCYVVTGSPLYAVASIIFSGINEHSQIGAESRTSASGPCISLISNNVSSIN